MEAETLDTRRLDRLVPGPLQERLCVVVGCGTTGSWTAKILLNCGFRRVVVMDHDVVESHNRPAQFNVGVSGQPKVESFSDAQKALGLPMPRVIHDRFGPHMADEIKQGSVVFSCVDTIEARRVVAAVARLASVHMLVDFRMGHEGGSVLFVSDKGPCSWDHYTETLRRPVSAEPACGKQALITTAFALVGIGLGHWIAAEAGRAEQLARVEINNRLAVSEGVEP